jgi:hypothetical protein
LSRPRDSIERQNLHDHLLAAKERIANELARAQSYGLLFVRHVDVCDRGIRKSAYDDCIETDVGMVVVDEGHCRLESCGIEVRVGDEKNSAKPERVELRIAHMNFCERVFSPRISSCLRHQHKAVLRSIAVAVGEKMFRASLGPADQRPQEAG